MYANSTIILKFNVTEAFISCTFNYSIDYRYQEMEIVENLNKTRDIDLAAGTNMWWKGADFVGSTVLNNLSDGKHCVTVYLIGGYDIHGPNPYQMQMKAVDSETVFFTVDTSPPAVSILAPLNATYEPSQVPLNFTVNEATSWMGYSLDGQENMTVTGNMTLPELVFGQHTLTVYANDTAGNSAASETVVTVPTSKPSLTTPASSVVLIVVAGASAATAVAAAAFYLKKSRR